VIVISSKGLRTALEIAKRNIPVVLRSPVHPLDKSNCSQGAGGLWMPYKCDDPRVDNWAIETLDEIHPLAADSNNSLVDLRYVLSLKRKHEGPDTEDMVSKDYHKGLGGKSLLPLWSQDVRLNFQNATLEQVAWQNQIHQLRLPSLSKAQAAGYNHSWFFQTPIVDCPKMLESLLNELVTGKSASNDENIADVDVNIETGVYYQSKEELFEEAKKLDCDAIVNCTGLGASKLCNDYQMIGARGALLVYDRKTCKRLDSTTDDEIPGSSSDVQELHDACIFAVERPWGSDEYPSYMIIRGDDIVVGGTCLNGDTEPTMRPEERTRLLENARLMGIDTNACQPKEDWVGFRPYRENIRCEIDDTDDYAKKDYEKIRLVHCYGTGGSGWTIYTGMAKEATRLVLQ
ncbi:MAG: D-amino-acid oxidase, partial [Bacillariaceae sp.]|jgi:D-amino-acid oxidase